jgi:hypothetical protein
MAVAKGLKKHNSLRILALLVGCLVRRDGSRAFGNGNPHLKSPHACTCKTHPDGSYIGDVWRDDDENPCAQFDVVHGSAPQRNFDR